MDLLFFGITLGMIGKVLLGITVIAVHSRIVKETKIDLIVIKQMKKEKNLVLLGIAFIVIGYFLEIAHYNYIFF